MTAATTEAAPVLGQYAKYIKPRLESDPEFRQQYIKTHVDKYMRRYKTDPEFKKTADERAKAIMRAKYRDDPEYRARKLEYGRLYRERQKALKSCTQSTV